MGTDDTAKQSCSNTLSGFSHSATLKSHLCTGLGLVQPPLKRLCCLLRSITWRLSHKCNFFRNVEIPPNSSLFSFFFFYSESWQQHHIPATATDQPRLTKLDHSLKWKLHLNQPVFWFLSKICEVRMPGY